jgi:hypothetical protein
MSERKKTKIKHQGICVFCGKSGFVTDDHIPPRCIFPSNVKNNELIVVPSCEKCNNKSSDDDEYLRLMIALREDVYEKVKDDQIQKILRSLNKPEKRKFATNLMKNMSPVNLFTPSGLFVGQTIAYNCNIPRIEKITEKIGKGLYYHEKGSPFPPNSFVRSICLVEIQKLPKNIKEKLSKIVRAIIKETVPVKSIAGDVFRYKIVFKEEKMGCDFILMLFFEKIGFLITLAPKKLIRVGLAPTSVEENVEQVSR